MNKKMTNIEKVLLVSLPSAISVYKESKIKEAISHTPLLSLACIGASLLENNHDVKVLDLSLYEDPYNKLLDVLKSFNPNFVGLSFTTVLYDEMKKIAGLIKKYNKEITIIGGGTHCTALPRETLVNSELDIVVIGEGDCTIVEIVEGKNISEVKGIAYKKNNRVVINESKEYIKNIDDLPFPAWNLFEIKKYYAPKLRSKASPVGPMETSRGCPFQCTFCSKKTWGVSFRPKSPKKVVDEIEYMLKCGFKEVHIHDECFTADIKRANEICDLIIERKLNFSWNIANGIRVDRITVEFLEKAKKAGCYSTGVGIESGSQRILNSVNKHINLDLIRRAVRMCSEVGIESVGYFIIGFPEDTEETLNETIKFACSLDLDMAKATILMPFPGTKIFDDLDSKNLILSKDWTNYNFHSSKAKKVFKHPNLSWETLFEYHALFHRKFYFRPKRILREIINSVKDGSLFYKMKVVLKIKW
jgi:radical SAM superfamily enzyme YgiQ (UPF0313 family)